MGASERRVVEEKGRSKWGKRTQLSEKVRAESRERVVSDRISAIRKPEKDNAEVAEARRGSETQEQSPFETQGKQECLRHEFAEQRREAGPSIVRAHPSLEGAKDGASSSSAVGWR